MNDHAFTLTGTRLHARPSGALWWPERGLLCVADLHLGKGERMARRGGAMLPPYEGSDTLARLEAEIAATGAERIICLGDSFDDCRAAEGLPDDLCDWLGRLSARRDWIWVEGNHDPAPTPMPGRHVAVHREGDLVFRHIATEATGELSGHYHPKAGLSLGAGRYTRPCFLIDADRAILPAFGTYTGGLDCTTPELARLMGPGAVAVLTGTKAIAIPMPRAEPDGRRYRGPPAPFSHFGRRRA